MSEKEKERERRGGKRERENVRGRHHTFHIHEVRLCKHAYIHTLGYVCIRVTSLHICLHTCKHAHTFQQCTCIVMCTILLISEKSKDGPVGVVPIDVVRTYFLLERDVGGVGAVVEMTGSVVCFLSGTLEPFLSDSIASISVGSGSGDISSERL